MPKISFKRQITLPVDQCQALNINPGDEVDCFIYQGHLTLVKKVPGAANGLLKQVKPLADITDDESIASNFE